jgi:hypothetical protein
METEEGEVAECIDDIVEILEDPKELRGRPDALEAVNKLKQVNKKFCLIICSNSLSLVTRLYNLF